MTTQPISTDVLRQLEPLGALSEDSLREISRMCYAEKISRNLDPFRLQGVQGQAVYLVKGELKIDYPDSSSEILVGGTGTAVRSLDKHKPAFTGAKAITDIELVRIDEELLDIMLTWDQLAAPQAAAGAKKTPDAADRTDWRTMSGMFAAENLTRGIFASLPPANIEALLTRFQRIKVARGEVVIREGEEGDFYYVIESGRCTVTRHIGGAAVGLAELKGGDAFGEEALVANTKRNATIIQMHQQARTDAEVVAAQVRLTDQHPGDAQPGRSQFELIADPDAQQRQQPRLGPGGARLRTLRDLLLGTKGLCADLELTLQWIAGAIGRHCGQLHGAAGKTHRGKAHPARLPQTESFGLIQPRLRHRIGAGQHLIGCQKGTGLLDDGALQAVGKERDAAHRGHRQRQRPQQHVELTTAQMAQQQPSGKAQRTAQ